MSNVPSYRIVGGCARNHSENVWGVRNESGSYVALGQAVGQGHLLGRKNALNLAVWLLRAIGATQSEVSNAMLEATSAPMNQGFRAQFGDDEP